MSMADQVTVTLPGGLWLSGERHQEASLRPLVGGDEAFVLETGESLFSAQRTTSLLARCLSRLGPLEPVTQETVQSLTVGDREALLLHLRSLSMGDRLQCVLNCPRSECGERIELDLSVNDLLLPAYAHTQAIFEAKVQEDGVAYRVRFRLPTGADQEAAAGLARSQPQAAESLLLRRCVDSVVTEEEAPIPNEEWPTAVAEQLPGIMAELDPQAELQLNLACPACEQAFSALFDTASFFYQELSVRAEDLYREVHALASYYHWSEAEILGMTARKRHRYLELLSESPSRGARR